MADMAGLDEAEQGVVATVLLASYLVTPTMAFSVSGIITVIVSTRLYKGLDYADALFRTSCISSGVLRPLQPVLVDAKSALVSLPSQGQLL
jgi:hypothetical protein